MLIHDMLARDNKLQKKTSFANRKQFLFTPLLFKILNIL